MRCHHLRSPAPPQALARTQTHTRWLASAYTYAMILSAAPTGGLPAVVRAVHATASSECCLLPLAGAGHDAPLLFLLSVPGAWTTLRAHQIHTVCRAARPTTTTLPFETCIDTASAHAACTPRHPLPARNHLSCARIESFADSSFPRAAGVDSMGRTDALGWNISPSVRMPVGGHARRR